MEPDPHFLPTEELYLRLRPTGFPRDFVDLRQVPLHEVRFPAFSVNRSKYSVPEDVLKPGWPKWGIAAFCVADIPETLPHPQAAITYFFHVEHLPKPEEDNYAHSEVRTRRTPSGTQEPPKAVKLEFRARLGARMKLLRAPQQG